MSDIDPLAAVRAVHIAATVAVAGALAFRLLLLPRPSPRTGGVGDAAAAVAARRACRWCSAALVVAIASWLAWLVSTAASMSGAAVADAVASDVLGTVLARTTFGHVWIVRLACMLALLVCLAVERRDAAQRVTPVAATAACLAL
ncbi:MAG: hypothetical protein JO090_12535, partial [Rhizobacter sp.]|nr:hypothetical protein [Rhizobacter sp.]